MKVLNTKNKLESVITDLRNLKKTIGFVPTMGALHRGHLSLVEKAHNENDAVIVSVFVNPTQFDNDVDLAKYPRLLEQDVALLKSHFKNIIVFAPSVNDVYNTNVNSEHFSFNGLEFEMEGKFRTGHFDGVGTILKFFFELIKPNKAYFGEKDFQQLRIVQTLAENLNLNISIIGCPIFREENGLAMSSRNERLPKETRTQAQFIYNTLKKAKTLFKTNSATIVKKWVLSEFKKNSLFKLEYIEISDVKTLQPLKRKQKNKKYRAFIAVFADNIRLIDNIALN